MKETEVKLKISNRVRLRTALRRLGWRVARRLCHERNAVYDRGGDSWLAAGRLLRVRDAGSQCLLTVKLPVAKLPAPRQGLHKVREELEIEVSDGKQLRRVLEAMDFRPAWEYEKYRTEFGKAGERGKILLDQTPVGDYLELEGAPRWIDQTAAELGFSKRDYIVETYRGLFVEYCKATGSKARDMLFGAQGLRTSPRAGSNER
jgi:adenylate cyclase class 2